MAKRKVINPLTQEPQTKSDITKGFMLAYMKSGKPSKEQIEKFKEIVKSNQKDYTTPKGEKYKDIDVPKVREEFCKLFFAHLVEPRKTFTDEILKINTEEE